MEPLDDDLQQALAEVEADWEQRRAEGRRLLKMLDALGEHGELYRRVLWAFSDLCELQHRHPSIDRVLLLLHQDAIAKLARRDVDQSGESNG